jgi:carboxylesterase type B
MYLDCLIMNIYRPANATDLPILIYFHDGFFQNGGIKHIDGSILSESLNSVIITVQYRLNIFGFLSVKSENFQNVANLGLYDQQKAIEFISENALAFGGDNNKITLAGIGSGGSSVGYHLMNRRRD